MHEKFQYYTARLNQLYLSHPALWERDREWGSGFEWIDPDNADESILSYRRKDAKGRELIVLINFTPVRRDAFTLAVPFDGRYEEIFSSDSEEFGGTGATNPGALQAKPNRFRDYSHAISVTVPPMGMAIFRCKRRRPTRGANAEK